MARNTRDRILSEARRLFNEQGYGNVTTAALAASVGIAEGNLWYHFKNKLSLLDALIDQFEGDIGERLALRPRTAADADLLDDYIGFVLAFGQELRDYRFLYRDHIDFGEHGERMASLQPHWYRLNYQQLESYYSRMIESGLLDWPTDRLDDLVTNATIIFRFSLEYFKESGQPVDVGSGAVFKALTQHLTLFEHRMDPAQASRLRAALERPVAATMEPA
jgi:AcrR family transcriptional regulator